MAPKSVKGLSARISEDALRKVVSQLAENRRRVANGEENAHPEVGFQRFRMPLKEAIRRYSEKKADARPSEENLQSMYDIVQADARLSQKLKGMGFGRNGDAVRKAYAKMRLMEMLRLLKDGKRIRNRVVHVPGYVPSYEDAARALRQYADAERRLDSAYSMQSL
jgi:hypothetical protein